MNRPSNQVLGRYLAAGLFAFVGTQHFVDSVFFVEIMPPRLPHPLALVYLSGACEILGAIGLLIPRCRRAAGLGLMLLLIAVFPANIRMFTQACQSDGFGMRTVGLALRLPVQFVFMAVVNWVSRSSPEFD